MPQIINTNIASLNAQRNLNRSQEDANTALQRLSSGLRINSAKDDAAGLAISERFTAQVAGLNQAVRNANDGISLAQVAEGALSESTDILQRIRELAIQSANSTNSATDRRALQAEVNQLKQELERIAQTTEFNGLKLLNGTFQAQTFQVGANENQNISVSVANATSSELGVYNYDSANGEPQKGLGSAAAAAADAASLAEVLTDQTLSIASPLGSVDDIDIASTDSAAQIAAKVNSRTVETGVSATARTTATLSGLSTGGAITFALGNGDPNSTAQISVSVDDTSDLSEVASEINRASGKTGITAVADGGSITLVQADGKNIVLEDFNHSTAGETIQLAGADENNVQLESGAADTTKVIGTVSFESSRSFALSSSDGGNAAAADSGLFDAAADEPVISEKDTVEEIDIGTPQGANEAIGIVDGALEVINGIRADLGAVQSRFESTIANLSTTSENLSAARSRIRDADFAAETAELARTQVLQSAGLSVLAQANARPQQVLQLLQG
ncbi:flagellin [Marinobacter nanhaiticus D15-8W]|uniref:Flagellin n=1 Tax=Marinobacter nanhaiticus D15-8W TaxID=626887 RepID=N6W062_9GAMM|nr:flagellin [Marinobacter nanhaiticus D15-8W]BES70888.1 flagellin [Marinobacter nanhaiticus D15-8W]